MYKTIIEPSNGINLNLKEIWQYRELLWTLTYRDIRVKYAQTAIGFAWAIVNPLFTLLILSFVFGTVANVKVEGTDGVVVPHIIYTITGLCGWQYFSEVLAQAGGSIIGAQNMVKKIYFPRLIIPMSKAITAFIDFAVVIIIMIICMIIYQFPPSENIIYFPLFFIIAVVSGLSAGIWMSALTIRFRDFQHITPMLLRIGMYATPIAYPASAVPEKYQLLFYMNPMAGVVEGMRWCIIGGAPLHYYAYISFFVIFLFLVFGLMYFKRVERVMADIL
ncbi:MAG: ABC transporter permease [Saprospiraceae bacterium]|nr:ABC transporter permease [Saprospiraceae bacterium]